jgi:hypothetical protein
MTTVNSILRPEVEFVSSGNRQADAENQKDAWLRQMELSQMAMLQQMGQQNTGSSGNGKANASPGSQSDHNAQQKETLSGAVQNASSGTTSEPTSTTLLPVHPIIVQRNAKSENDTDASVPAGTANSSMQPARDAAAATPYQAKEASAANQVTLAQTANQVTLAQTANQVTLAQTANQATLAQTATAVHSRQPTSVTTANQITAAAAVSENATLNQPSIALTTVASAPFSETTAEQILTTAPTTVTSLASVALRATINLAPEAKEEADEATEQQKTETAEAPDTASNEAWQKRLIHVAQDGQNLSVSIRDNALDAHQSTQIVYQMASDAAQSGFRLRNATVNGKALLKLPGTPSSKGSSASPRHAGNVTDSITPTLELQEHSRGT